jgi:hypothetical protein
MGEPNAGRDLLSVAEVNLLLLLDTAGHKLYMRDGSIRWALDADDLVCLLELGGELAGGSADAAIWNRVGALLGIHDDDEEH